MLIFFCCATNESRVNIPMVNIVSIAILLVHDEGGTEKSLEV